DSPDIPESERTVFRQVWPDDRQNLVVALRGTIGVVRDFVRVMDEMGDYAAFSVPRRNPQGTDQPNALPEDPQLTDLRRRARAALDKLESAIKASSKAQ